MFDDEIRKMFERMRKMLGEDAFSMNTGFFPNNGEDPKNENIEDELDTDDVFDIPKANNPFKNTKSYFISYKFGTDMDKPEVNVSGDIPPDEIEKFLSQIQGGSNISPEKIHNLQSVSKQRPLLANEPIVDIYEEDEYVHIAMELPGVEKDDIELLAAPNEIEVNGKSIKLPTQIDINSAISRLKNGILTIKLKKAKQDTLPKRKLEIE